MYSKPDGGGEGGNVSVLFHRYQENVVFQEGC